MTGLVIVTIPEELPSTETLETMRWLEENQIVPPPFLIANRVLPELEDQSSPEGVVGEIADLHRSLWSEQQNWLSKVPPDLTLPYMFGLFTPGEVAAHMSDQLEAAVP